MVRIFRCRCDTAKWLLAISAMVLVCGCGNPKVGGDVWGIVKLGGKTVPKGAITFHSADGRTAISEINDGSYRVRKPPLGPCKITILTAAPPPPGNGINPDPKWLRPPGYLEVPERYGKVQTSPLALEVVNDPQTKDFDLDLK